MLRVRIGLCLLLLSATGQSAEPATAQLLSEPFLETYQPEVEVSGNVIVGVMSPTAQAALIDDRLGVQVSEALGGGEVCLRATSNDGIYNSRNHYRLPETPGRAHLPYASDMNEVLIGFQPGELAVSIARGDCESTATSAYLVASTVDDAETVPVTIYLNGFGATDVFFAYAGEEELRSCEYITEGRRTTYDFFCTLELGNGGEETITLVRERFGREQPEITLNLIGLSG